MTTFYWHDYETWGTNPAVDHPSQFAGVRTDENLNIIGEPLVIYCRPPRDILPWAEACLVTGITPQKALAQGVSEAAFMAAIHRELATPGTCGVGYNSLRFDDEITRYSLYRNFYDPYEREWRNGNSRWDIIDMVRLVYALRPEGIEWPLIDGKPSFKLELLTQANGIAHRAAHDAFSDVEATIALAKLIKQKKGQLYEHVLNQRSKRVVGDLIDVRARKPLLHISSRFPASRGCAGLVVPLAAHPTNRNAVIVYELSVDPGPLDQLTAEQIAERVFVSADDLPEGQERLPIKLIHLNKCPILLPSKMLDEHAAKRLGIDRSLCEQHWHKLLGMDVEYKLRQLYTLQSFPPKQDPEQQLYDGFIGDSDKQLMRDFREADAGVFASNRFLFDDPRLNAMQLRYKGRNFPEALSEVEHGEWLEFCRQRIVQGGDGVQSLSELRHRVAALEQQYRGDERAQTILASVLHFAENQLEDLPGE